MTLPLHHHANDNHSAARRIGRAAGVFSLRMCVVSGCCLAALVALLAMGTWAIMVASWLVKIIFAATKAVLT